MGNISLLAWSKARGVTYTMAQKWVNQGVLQVERTKNRVLIDEQHPAPEVATVRCEVCQRDLPQISNSHLKLHGLTVAEYQTRFPDAPIITKQTREKISEVNTGIVRSEENRKRISEGRKGIRPENHPRYVKGAYSPSEETRRKMAEARLGALHDEETKRKIGDAHRGVPETREAIEANRQAQLEYWKDKPGSNLGRVFNDEERAAMVEGRMAWEQTLTPEYRAERRARLIAQCVGKKRTPEQRETYRRARLKYMEENPEVWQKFTETNLEIEFKAWCDELEIECRPQCFISEGDLSHPFDFYLPEYGVLVECDGPHHWEGPWWSCPDPKAVLAIQIAADQVWTRRAEELGYTVVRLRGRNSIGDEGSGSIDEQMLKVLNAS